MSVVWEVDTERIATLEAAVAAVGGNSPSRARLLANLAMELTYGGDFERRERLSQKAVELARRLDDPATLAHVLIGRFNAIATTHTLAERVALTAELVDLAERLGDPAVGSRAWFVRYRATLEAGDVAEADRAIEAFTKLATELNQPALHWTAAWIRAGRQLLAGRIPEAEAEMHRALEMGQASGQPDATLFFHYQLFHVRFEQGRLGEIEETWVDLIARYPRVSAATRALLALHYHELGREEEARAALEPLAASGFDIPLDAACGHATTHCAAMCSYLGDTTGAALLWERLAPYAGQLPLPGGGIANGAIAHYLGLLATTLRHWEQAEANFQAAAAIHARIGAPTWLARTRLEWARMLLARRPPGDAERARELLGETLATARELGLAKLERDAVALLT